MRYCKQILLVISIGLILIVIGLPGIRSVLADEINPGAFSIDSKPYGLSYPQWAAKWWQWLLSIPSDTNPAADKTGINCALGQKGPAWFLAGTFGGSATRTCSVPLGKAIFVCPITGESSYKEYPQLKSESELRTSVLAADQGQKGTITVDGVAIKDLAHYRATSGLFNLTLPKNNVLDKSAGDTQAVADVLCVMLKPLSPGNHTIGTTGVNIDPNTGAPSFSNEVEYKIKILP
jgi:hypothetical protein